MEDSHIGMIVNRHIPSIYLNYVNTSGLTSRSNDQTMHVNTLDWCYLFGKCLKSKDLQFRIKQIIYIYLNDFTFGLGIFSTYKITLTVWFAFSKK